MTVAGARENAGNQVVPKTRIPCFNCKEYGHFAKECMKLKQAKDYECHNEKMMLSHYLYMAKIQEVLHVTDDNSRPTYNAEPLEKDEKNANDDEDEHVMLANLIAN
uniref:CCHC-type domain-containing protein n=1 Tax=Tanacetum cinerariifolium TaxID=118510 RepID=A0A6L2J6W8_TANCI|nr:hypothetical protein [Tanacetum cinerariifolium]